MYIELNYPSDMPCKLIKIILDLEFIDMVELVPESWRFADDDDLNCCHQSHYSTKRGSVTNILLWLECFASLVAVLATKYPTKVPHLLAKLKTFMRIQKTAAGT